MEGSLRPRAVGGNPRVTGVGRAVIKLVSLWLVVCAIALTMAPGPAQAQGSLTAVDGNSSITVNPLSQDGLHNWTVGGTNHMSQQWFWFRLGDTGPEASLETLSLITADDSVPGEIFLEYGMASEPLTIEVFYGLLDAPFGPGTSAILEFVSITNNSPDPIDLRWFEYTDLDLDGTANGDSAIADFFFFFPGIIQSDINTAFVASEPLPDHFEIAFFPSTLNGLNDGVLTDLADSPFSLGPGDITHAFQYNFDALPGGDTAEILKIKLLGTPVPEPSSLLLLGTGLAGLARLVVARHRHKA